MKKTMRTILVFCAILFAFGADAAYQIYDIQLKVKTTKPIRISLPYPMNYYFSQQIFRTKVTETMKGYLVCYGPYNLNNPDFVYLKNLSTGEEFFSGSGLHQSWDVYDRLSPVDKSVELKWNFWWTAAGGYFYDIYGAGEGKIKTAKYKKVFSKGTSKVTIADGLKGEFVGSKSLPCVYGVSMDGESTLGNADSVIHGTWKIKYNNRLSMALYRYSARSYGICADGESKSAAEDGDEVSVGEIRQILGL